MSKKTILILMGVAVVIAIIITSFVSCEPKFEKYNNYVVLNRTDVLNFINKTNKVISFENHILIDDVYLAPSVKWIKKEYTQQLKKFLYDNQLRKYVSEENDCDDFSLYGVAVGHMVHRYSKDKPKKSSLAIGEFAYNTPNLDPHAINFFIAVDDDDKLRLIFYEPQTQEIVDMKPENLVSIWWKM